MRVLMVAAENDAIAGAKVGGVADVVRDTPIALAAKNVLVDVVIPDYGSYGEQQGSECVGHFSVFFAKQTHYIHVYRIPSATSGVTQYVISHELFHNGGKSPVYSHDGANRPFATDATKFALFCLATAEAMLLGVIAKPDVLHLHDWHAATLATLLVFDHKYHELSQIHRAFTVHNLALQGTRPFQGDESSFESWFPYLSYDGQQICDPHAPHCYNPMRAGISLSDKVHLVSKSYSEEVLKPSNQGSGYYGGEGLEEVLHHKALSHQVVGILNGCNYDEKTNPPTSFKQILQQAKTENNVWMSQFGELKTVHYLASERIKQWLDAGEQSGPLLTSIGRLTEQKVRLLNERYNNTKVLELLLLELNNYQGRFILLGSGDPYYEYEFMKVMAKHENFLFLNGFGLQLSEQLYQVGDLFIMPSSFEPCGISQMLALRAGQPCLVHQVGGLKDTVHHLENGFVFAGETILQQCEGLLNALKQSLSVYNDDQKTYQTIRENAKNSRFDWHDSVEEYLTKLYC